MKYKTIVTALIIAHCFIIKAQEEYIVTLRVKAGKFEYHNSPVCFDIDSLSTNSDSLYLVMYETTEGKKNHIPIQIETGNKITVWWMLDSITPAGKDRTFELYYSQKKEEDNRLGSSLDNSGLMLKCGEKNILKYNHSVHYPPEGVDSIFMRSGFIHPLWTPGGNILTRINPPDHYHHYGIWNPWTKVSYKNKVIDFWNLGKEQGTVMFKDLISTVSGSLFAGFKALHNHVIFEENEQHVNILNEIWDVRAWTVLIEDKPAYIIDFASFLSCASDELVVLEKYRYGGGIGFRATEEWTNKNSYVLTSEGKTRENADASYASWAVTGGSFKNNTYSAIAFFSHPSNINHPEPMRIWPVNSNGGRGDVFFEFCPVRHERWVINPGKIYRQKYRMLVYDGKINTLNLEKIWNGFAHPPEVISIIEKTEIR